MGPNLFATSASENSDIQVSGKETKSQQSFLQKILTLCEFSVFIAEAAFQFTPSAFNPKCVIFQFCLFGQGGKFNQKASPPSPDPVRIPIPTD